MNGSSIPAMDVDWTPEAGERLDWIIARVGGLAAAARIAGKSDDALMRWRRGESRWDCWCIARLCAAAGRSIDWLVHGGGAAAAAGRLHQDAVMDAATFVLRAAKSFPTLAPEEIARSILQRARILDGAEEDLTDQPAIGDQYTSR